MPPRRRRWRRPRWRSATGARNQVRCGGRETILDAALRLGIELPHLVPGRAVRLVHVPGDRGRVHLKANDHSTRKTSRAAGRWPARRCRRPRW